MEARMRHTWKQEWAIHGSKNGLHVEVRIGARVSYIWKQEWAIHGSKNGPYMEVRMGYMWK